jgi:hypothetical protein
MQRRKNLADLELEAEQKSGIVAELNVLLATFNAQH